MRLYLKKLLDCPALMLFLVSFLCMLILVGFYPRGAAGRVLEHSVPEHEPPGALNTGSSGMPVLRDPEYQISAARRSESLMAAEYPESGLRALGYRAANRPEPAGASPAFREKENTRLTVLKLPFGSSLGSLLDEAGFTPLAAGEVSEALSGLVDLTRLKAGQEVEILASSSGAPLELRIPLQPGSSVTASVSEGRWRARKETVPLHAVPVLVRCRVGSSLYQTALDAGIPLAVMMQAIDLFSFEVDFQRDIQSGEKLTLLYEELADAGGKVLAPGEVIFAALEVAGERVEAWRYESAGGKTDYYGEDGSSVRKSLLKTPVSGARISSGFGYRNHPILGYTALHRGVDFAVASGTPVFAAGDGRVVIAGWHKSYGYRVKLRHANHYDTMYAHFSSIARGIVPGVQVKQGQVVGYVGSTGMSTGPHCHYEVHYYGSPVNPATLKFPPRHNLEAGELRLFTLERQALKAGFGL